MRVFRNMQFLNNGRISRRVSACLLFLSFFLSVFHFIPDVHAQIAMAGDLAPRGNPDGRLTMADVIVLERMVLGDITPTTEELLIGDVAPVGNPDGVLDMSDVQVLQRAILGYLNLPPVNLGPPSPPDLGKIDIDIGNGVVTVIGTAGSVEPNATVTIESLWAEDQITVTANADGSFSGQIAAPLGAPLSITVSNSAGESSTPVDVRVMKVAILQPASGVTVYGDTLWVSGKFWAPSYADVSVNGVFAATSGNDFVASIPLVPGTNTITASAFVSGEEMGIKQVITVNSVTGTSPVQVTVAPLSGLAPLTVQFTPHTSGPSLQRIQIDFDSDNTIDFDSLAQGVPAGNAVTEVYAQPGVYEATVVATDSGGNAYVSRHTITVGLAKDAMLRDIYQHMVDNLRHGNINGAVAAFSGSAQEKYRAIFTSLQANLPAIADQLGTLDSGVVGEDWGEYVLLRDENGQPRAYLIYFMRGEDGVWRIDGM